MNTTERPAAPKRAICHCGHVLAIHEFPMACRGAICYQDDEVRCDCHADYSWEQISKDRAAADSGIRA